MLTKLLFQTLFGFKPKRRLSASKTGKKVAKKSASKAGKKVVKKSNKVGTRMIKGVKRTVYKGKNGGKFYKKADGRKVYFGPAMALAVQVMSAKVIEGAGYTVGYKAANVGVSMLKKAIKKNKKTVAMGRKKIVAGKKRTVYKTATGAKYYKSAKGNKVYFGDKGPGGGSHVKGFKDLKKTYKTKTAKKMHNASKHTKAGWVLDARAFPIKFGKKRKSRRNTRFGGNHGYADLMSMAGPSPAMFASSMPRGL